MVEASMDVLGILRKQIEETEPDILRALMQSMLDMLMSADADAQCGAGYRERSEERQNHRNGYRSRPWDSRLGSMVLDVPKLRHGSYFPEWLLQPRRRVEKALVGVVAEAYVNGVSTRRMEKLVESLGIKSLSKSQVSEMARELDEVVADFRNRPLSGGYPYVWVDALAVRCREGGRVVSVCVMIATGVNSDGHRQILGLEVSTSEDEAAWTDFLRGLKGRGLSGVKLVISDAHKGLKAAIASEMPGVCWQRCRTHFARNLLCKVPKKAQDFVAAALRTVFAQPTKEDAREALHKLVGQLDRFPEASALLEDAADDILAFADFPDAHWKQIWSNNPQERLNKEIRRRTDVVGIFPNRESIIRLVGAVLCEQNDEWMVTRSYMTQESLKMAAQIGQMKQEMLTTGSTSLRGAAA